MSLLFPNPPDDYRAGQPQWFRVMMWAIRNPFSAVSAKFAVAPILGPDGKPQSSWGKDGNGRFDKFPNGLPRFISHRTKTVEWYIGWRPSGLFGIGLRRAHAQNYNVKPNFQPPVHD